MISLTRLNQAQIVVNSDLIELIEMTPDTVITLTTGQKILVRETTDEVIDRVIHFRRTILEGQTAFQSASHSRPSSFTPETLTARSAKTQQELHGQR
jgi:flagellar protein FlbD